MPAGLITRRSDVQIVPPLSLPPLSSANSGVFKQNFFYTFMLSKQEILKEIKNKNISITPFEKRNIGPCSVDLRLGYLFRRFKKNKKKIVVREEVVPDNFSELIKLNKNEELKLKSGELILGTTLEKIKLSEKICGRLDGRSRFARIGLMVHVSSSLVQPGVNNHQVLEIINLSPFSLYLLPETRICQITFDYLTSSARYVGDYRFQTTP